MNSEYRSTVPTLSLCYPEEVSLTSSEDDALYPSGRVPSDVRIKKGLP